MVVIENALVYIPAYSIPKVDSNQRCSRHEFSQNLEDRLYSLTISSPAKETHPVLSSRTVHTYCNFKRLDRSELANYSLESKLRFLYFYPSIHKPVFQQLHNGH